MGMAAFNRARAQQAALQDAAARKAQEEVENMEAVKAAPVLVEDQDELASPPYADADQLINVRGDSDLDREMEAMRQACLNRTRNLSREALDELQNSHLHEPKVKAIPDPNEVGKDRSRKGQKAMRAKAEAPYKDDRVKPIPDGRLMAQEPETERPNGDTSVSPVITNVDTFPMHEADDPKFIEKLAEQYPITEPENSEPMHPLEVPPSAAEAKEPVKRRGRASQRVAEDGEGQKEQAAMTKEVYREAEKAQGEADQKPSADDSSEPAPDTAKKTADTDNASKKADEPDQPSDLQKPTQGK